VKLEVITFGSPRVGDKKFAAYYNNKIGGSTFRIVHWKDLVPHVPTKSMGYHHVAREIWYNSKSTKWTVCNSSGEDKHCSNKKKLPSVNDHLKYMGYRTHCADAGPRYFSQ